MAELLELGISWNKKKIVENSFRSISSTTTTYDRLFLAGGEKGVGGVDRSRLRGMVDAGAIVEDAEGANGNLRQGTARIILQVGARIIIVCFQ